MKDFEGHPINRTWTMASKLDLYRQMVRIRAFEKAALKYYRTGRMGGFLATGLGQEAIAAGVRSLMGPSDHSISGWRGMGHALAAGMEMGPCMAELFGR